MSNMDELRYLTEIANDPSLAEAKRRFKKGVKKLKQKLKRGTRKSSELQSARGWNRTISGNAIIKYGQFDPELATVVVVSVRPERFGGGIVVVDGQHTGMMDIFGECDQELDTLELHHKETATLEEIQEAEARLYKALNTQRKNPSKLDIIRNDIFLEEPYAMQFENILKLCNLNVDGIGAIDGDIIGGSGSRIIKTIEQYGEDFSHYIPGAVNFMRDVWGSDDNPLQDIRDDMIHGLTTLFVFVNNVGKIEGGTPNGLNGRKKKLLSWMNSEMGKTSMRKYWHNTAGGNTHFKIVHNIISEYNFWAEENASTMTISSDYLHSNGILDPNKILSKQDRKDLPSFPSDIKIS
jgi:hypothetical protein